MESEYDWAALREELALWRKANLTLPIWWRDDDAEDVTSALERLAALSAETGVPVHLAVVPRNATSELSDFVKAQSQLMPVVHGWAHRNYEPEGQPKSEFGECRPVCASLEEAREGLRRLQILFGDHCAPMFVPPWTNISDQVVQGLGAAGYHYLSTIQSRRRPEPAPNLTQVNAHLDPVAWREANQQHSPSHLFRRSVEILQKRRTAELDNAEPFGLLTHHKAMNDENWAFSRRFLMELTAGPVSFFDATET